eukprot:TRINITY_DN47237_c0_g1_i1.p1 TRINITY_DN47237_c0_g1~~TRINITY_DN47237_c0_g1_i1.p1  ORF type:complete len:1201 (+),score=529.48 TRINITY_DN47237_c0_g1_i1:83-3604(+)
MNFLDEENMCGQQLLKLVARGSAVIAELLRLSTHIPPVFYATDKRSEYSALLFDFQYLKKEDEFEQAIQANHVLIEKDEEFRETHMEILHRFYQLFESIWRYVTDLLRFWEDIRDGFYIQQTFESILVDQDGKQLMAESIYLYGVMLLLLDMKIEGRVRERMLISYLRYKGAGEVPNLDDICRLCRTTGGYGPPGATRPRGKPSPGYPEDFFARIKLPTDILDMCIGRIRSDDIYQMAYNFPAPEHRSASLSTQGAMLYVMLYFRPKLMHESKPVMREIADKHFPDNWIISFYMGFTVDLTVAWAPYKAASGAIANTMQLDNLQYFQKMNCERLHKLNSQLKSYQREGVLTEAYVLDNIHSLLLPALRDCNVTLRWLCLHLETQDKRTKQLVSQGFQDDDVLNLLLNTSQLEYLLQEMFTQLLRDKSAKWDECKETAMGKMTKLSQYFGQEGVLAAETKEETLAAWFSDISEKIEELDYENSTQAGRKIQNLISALTDVEEYHQVDSNLQVRQFLMDTRALLKTMVRYVNIEDRVRTTISAIGDFSYGWELIGNYVPMMQNKIKKNPAQIMQLRSTFLKLSTMLELPCTRIAQASSLDIASVSEYYSTELVNFVRLVLAIIPSSMFQVLENIIHLLTNVLVECETRMPKDKLRERAQLDERYNLARYTHQISRFTDGILAMEKTLMGIIQIDPQRLLEDGIRKELVAKLASILHDGLQFVPDKKGRRPPFEERVAGLGKSLQGMKQSFEYIQDYANVYGLRIWQEEFSRLVNFNVEMECNRFLTKKIYEWQSRFQSEAIPIPRFPAPEGDRCVNFMGRLVDQLLEQTDSRRTMYVSQLSAWYDERGHAVVGLHTFGALHSAIDTPGMAGLDKLLSFMIVKDLQSLILKGIKRDMMREMSTLYTEMQARLSPPSILPKSARDQYSLAEAKGKKFWPFFLDTIIRVGRCQLLRKHIGKELRFACKLDSPALYESLTILNKALLNDVQAHYKAPMDKLYPNGRKPIMPHMTEYLSHCGMNDPYTQIYLTLEPMPHIALVLLSFVIAHLPRFQYDPQTDCLVRQRLAKQKEPDLLDGAPFALGVLTVLKQFHSEFKDAFVAHLCQFCRVVMNDLEQTQAKQKEKERETLPAEVCNCLQFLEMFCKFGSVDRKQIENFLPPFLLARYKEFSARVAARK